MSTLTSRQKTELNRAIMLYLRPRLEPELYEDVLQSLGISQEELSGPDTNLLEKKWLAVIRLQKKILDLETQVLNLNEALDASGAAKSSSGTVVHTKINWLPSRPLSVLKGHKAALNSIDIHPLMPELYTGLADGSVVIWDLLNPVQPSKVVPAHTKAVNGVAFSKKPVELSPQDTKGAILLASCLLDMTIKIWDATTLELRRTLSGHTHAISKVMFKKDNPRHLFLCSRDGSVILWDVVSGWRIRSFVGHSDWVRAIDLSITDEYIISCSNDLSCRLLHGDSGTGLAMMVGHTHVVEDCKFAVHTSWPWLDMLAEKTIGETDPALQKQYESLGFKYCATASRDNTIRIWLLPVPIMQAHKPPAPPVNLLAECLIELKGHHSWVRSLQFHPGGKYLFSSSDDKSIKIWDLSAIQSLGIVKCIRTLNNCHEGFINCIKFADPVRFQETDKDPDEVNVLNRSIRTIFASGGTDNTLCVW